MTSQKIQQLLRKTNPVTADDLKNVLAIHHLDDGFWRSAYHIKNSRWVIKFPQEPFCRSHSQKEMRVVHAISHCRSFRHLRRYCPKILYQNSRTGVVVMEFLTQVGEVPLAECRIIEWMFRDTFQCRKDLDIGYTNLGYGAHQQIKILDFGCVTGKL